MSSTESFPRSALKTFNIHSQLLFHTPLQNWTVNALNMSPITHLSLRYLDMSPASWAKILARISIPTLFNLTIRVKGLAFADFSRFISRHPRIAILDFEHLSSGFQTDHLESTTMPNLSIVITYAGTLAHILQSKYAFPSLGFISISALINQDKSQPLEFALLDHDLATIVRRRKTKEIPLLLQLSGLSGSMDWLRVYGVKRGRNRVERSLYCVTTLILSTKWCFACSNTTLSLLPHWLALFPALQRVTFLDHCTQIKQDDKLAFIRSIAMVCPGVRTITINDVQSDVAACLAKNV